MIGIIYKLVCFYVDDPVQDSYLGDCCRETGDDWLLSKLDVRAKILLLKFLSDQAEVYIKKHDK